MEIDLRETKKSLVAWISWRHLPSLPLKKQGKKAVIRIQREQQNKHPDLTPFHPANLSDASHRLSLTEAPSS